MTSVTKVLTAVIVDIKKDRFHIHETGHPNKLS